MDEDTFLYKAQILKEDPRILCSSHDEWLEHPICQEIIAEGRRVIPFIMEDFKRDGEFPWDVVLQNIVGFCPSSEEHRGCVEAIRQDWLKWGREKGYLND